MQLQRCALASQDHQSEIAVSCFVGDLRDVDAWQKTVWGESSSPAAPRPVRIIEGCGDFHPDSKRKAQASA